MGAFITVRINIKAVPKFYKLMKLKWYGKVANELYLKF